MTSELQSVMMILAIDPGPEKSGWLMLNDGVPEKWGWLPNEDLINKVSINQNTPLAIEDVSHFGPKISVGQDVFDTCKWMGRFQQAHGGQATYIKRQKIKIHLTGMATAKDKNIRIALIDRFGGEAVAIGGKKCPTCHGVGLRGRGIKRGPCPSCWDAENPVDQWTKHSRGAGLMKIDGGSGYATPKGPLHGITAHCWSALAVGVTYLDTRED